MTVSQPRPLKLLCLTSASAEYTGAQHSNGRELLSRFTESIDAVVFNSARTVPDSRLVERPNITVKQLRAHGVAAHLLFEALKPFDYLFYMQPGLAEDLYVRYVRQMVRVVGRRRPKLVVWVEGDIDAYAELRPSIRDRALRIIRAADVVVAITPFVARQLESRGIPVAAVIPVGVDTDTFSPPQAARSGSSAFRFVTVASLKPWKQVDWVCEVAKRIGNATFVVIGEGAERLSLEQMAPRNVVFLGALGKRDVRDNLREADAMIHASRREGMPKAVLEAMACGLPVALLNRYGADAFISHGIDGLLARDLDELTSMCAHLVHSSKLCEEIGAAARRRAEMYRWTSVARQWEALLVALR